MTGKIIVISGPSGAGKTTLYKKVLEDFREYLDFSVSATTREPREGETDGKDYHFIKPVDFDELVVNDEFVEWAFVHRHMYGTLKSEIKRITDAGKSVLLDLDVQGALNIRKVFPQSHLIFIEPPSVDELRRRLEQRQTDSEYVRQTRMNNAIEEMNQAHLYKYRIVNDDLQRAYKELKKTIRKILDS